MSAMSTNWVVVVAFLFVAWVVGFALWIVVFGVGIVMSILGIVAVVLIGNALTALHSALEPVFFVLLLVSVAGYQYAVALIEPPSGATSATTRWSFSERLNRSWIVLPSTARRLRRRPTKRRLPRPLNRRPRQLRHRLVPPSRLSRQTSQSMNRLISRQTSQSMSQVVSRQKVG